MKHIVVGLGEVGGSLRSVLQCDGYDKNSNTAKSDEYDFMHVCFGYFEGFEDEVRRYQELWKPKYTVIHSTVPIGTSRLLGASHSPIRGRHPDLAQSILRFTKYVGGKNSIDVAIELQKYSIPALAIESSDETEAGKLIDLMQFGASIMLEKEIHRFCEEHDLNFDVVYSRFNATYNDGYQKLGCPEFTRPIIKHMPGKIGGHCVSQMMELLPMHTAKRIIVANKML